MNPVKTKLRALHADTLFRNSLYLMLATVVIAGFGFFFWLFAAHLFNADDIGLATTLISAMSLIALLSLIGFDTVFIRYLPNSTQRDDKVNTGMILVSIFACILAIVFLIFLPHLASKLLFVRGSFWTMFVFVLFCGLAALNTLTDAFFMANRQAKYTLVINVIFSLIKVAVIFLFAGRGPIGIFIAAGIAQFIGTVLSVVAMVWKFGYKPALKISLPVIRQVRRYSSATYLAGLLNLLPPTILPIIIIDRLGAEQSAYFYIVLMFANLLYATSYATTRSLFAEGSHNERELGSSVRKAIKIIAYTMLPGIVAIMVIGPSILSIFGKEYSKGGTELLRIMAVSGIFVSIYSVLSSLLRITKNLTALIVVNIIYAATIIGLAYTLTPRGLTGVGIAWLAGNLVASLLFLAYLPKNLRAQLTFGIPK